MPSFFTSDDALVAERALKKALDHEPTQLAYNEIAVIIKGTYCTLDTDGFLVCEKMSASKNL